MNAINFIIFSKKIRVSNSGKRIILDNKAECTCCYCENKFDYEYSITIDDEDIFYGFYRSGQSQNYLKDVSNLRYDYYPPPQKCPGCGKFQPWMFGNIRNDYLLYIINIFVSAILFGSMIAGYLVIISKPFDGI